jgi:cytidyltransferase-like protein
MKNIKVGYCALTADGLHVGHIRFLDNCKRHCVYLIVGIMSDYCVLQYKGRKPLMNFKQRKRIVESLKQVDETVMQNTFQFPEWVIYEKLANPDNFFIFDNEQYEKGRFKADCYFPYWNKFSSTKLKRYYGNTDNSERKI